MMDSTKILELFRSQLKIMNVGPAIFSEALEKQGFSTVQVDWIPPAGGDRDMQKLLEIMGGLD